MNKLRRMFFRVQRKKRRRRATARLFDVAIEKTSKHNEFDNFLKSAVNSNYIFQ